MMPRFAVYLLLMLLSVGGTGLCASATASRSVEHLLDDAADGSLDRHNLLQATLIAGGCDPVERQVHQRRFDELCRRIEAAGLPGGDPRTRARALYEQLHREILVGQYIKDCSDVPAALHQGDFNCVSATILFHCLAARFDLNVVAVETPGHVYSRVVSGDSSFDVQTTCPHWFEILDAPAKLAEASSKIPGMYPAGANITPRVLPESALAAMVFYNHGVDLLRKGRFTDAIEANQRALRLDPHSVTARGNLLAAMNNYAVTLCDKGHMAAAVAMVTGGLAIDPQHAALRSNDLYVHGTYVEALCRARRWDEARDVLEQARRHRPMEPWFHVSQVGVYRRQARELLAREDLAGALAVFGNARRRFPGSTRVLEAESSTLNHRALTLARQGRLADALSLLDAALVRQPRCRLLQQSRRMTAQQQMTQASVRN
jgi:pentatricopeptide repeat protein